MKKSEKTKLRNRQNLQQMKSWKKNTTIVFSVLSEARLKTCTSWGMIWLTLKKESNTKNFCVRNHLCSKNCATSETQNFGRSNSCKSKFEEATKCQTMR